MWIWPNMRSSRKFYQRWMWRARNPNGDFEGGTTMTKMGARYKSWKVQRGN